YIEIMNIFIYIYIYTQLNFTINNNIKTSSKIIIKIKLSKIRKKRPEQMTINYSKVLKSKKPTTNH
ncbi:MAG: hypothetical protein K6253_00765, partial [Candidatus Liberibacter asiaticus]|nr:hypothetical protein [Candidatus Liberibacter asiaticus]